MYPEEEANLLKPYTPTDPIFTVDSDYISRARSSSKREESPCGQALEALLVDAERALKQEPLTIVNKPILPPSGDKHDYMSVGAYWWPDPDKPDGLPYIRRDGEPNPEAQTTDRPLLGKLVSTVKSLGFAYGFTGREDYASRAALQLRTWFLDPKTKMNPHLTFGQARPGITDGTNFGLIETAAFAREMLPAISFLRESENWSTEDMHGLQAWFHAFLEWMLTQPLGVAEARHGNNHSSAYDVQVSTYALFVGQPDLARVVLEGVGDRRIAQQIEPDGQQPRELARTKALGYSSMNLSLLLELAEIGRQWGIDLINFETDDRRSIKCALDWLFPYWTGEQEWTFPQIQPFEWERAFRCLRLAAYQYLNKGYEPIDADLAGVGDQEKARQLDNLLNPPFEGQRLHGLPIGKDVVFKDPEPLVDPDFTNGETTLTEAEIEFFKEKGFLVKRGLLDEKETFSRVVDHVWENVPRDLVKRDDPTTWIDAPQGEWTAEDRDNLGLFRRGSWKMRSRTIGTQPFFVDKIANNPRMQQTVESFIGGPVKRANRVRGVYCIFPKSPDRDAKLGPHGDHTGAQLSAMVFADTLPPHCGGFTIWPGSHYMSHPYHRTVHGPLHDDLADDYVKARDEILRRVTPVQFHGKVGDVVFWHPRLVHGPGINYSAEHDQPVVRYIVPCEYQKDGLTSYFNLSHGPAPNRQWWVDTKNFREDVPATPENIWDGWAFRVG
ncbi:alginate lyase family protein [bacterium]|jgi:hypothetical protein|nr:hypothetical protein [Gemmatimonadota bacterium]MBE83872.1 hypothetical protein [Gemmatimonadota bacterium]MCH2663320.1 alginate lyase family protein [bacterium]